MSEYKAPKFGYIDSDGKFIALDTDSITSTPITSLNIGSRMTVKPSYDTCVTNRDYTAMAYTKAYIDKYVENMFDKIKDYKVYNKTTVVYFTDGTKETVTCSDEDNFDVEQGITMCVIKRMLGDKYKKYVRSIVKAKTINEKNVKELEAAHKEAQLREERKEKRNRENKIRMKARYEARLAVAIEEEKKKLKENRKIKNTF